MNKEESLLKKVQEAIKALKKSRIDGVDTLSIQIKHEYTERYIHILLTRWESESLIKIDDFDIATMPSTIFIEEYSLKYLTTNINNVII